MRTYLVSAAVGLLLLSMVNGCNGCSKEKQDAGTDDPKSAPAPAALLEQPIDVSTADAIVDVPGKIHVVVPKGAMPASSTIKISQLPPDVPMTNSSGEYKVMQAFNVEIAGQTTFAKPLKITLPIDRSYITDPEKRRRVAAVYYSAEARKWVGYPRHSFDEKSGTISFETYHLTPTGWLDYIFTGGYTDVYTSGRFQIFYNRQGKHAPMSNQAYNNDADYDRYKPNPKAHPSYVLDAATFLEEASRVYRNTYKLPSPDPTKDLINVYIKDTGSGKDRDGDGEYGPFSGAIFLCNVVKKDAEWEDDPRATNELYLRKAAAHELFHLEQDYYYAFAAGLGVNMWWLEALATQADTIVDPTISLYEGVMYAKKHPPENTTEYGQVERVLHYNLARSWDDCGSAPRYYVAGAFLTYMAHYRPGAKLNIVKLVTSKKLGRYRSILDDEIKTQLGSTIGDEFASYVKFLYESKNEDFNLMAPQFFVADPAIYPCFERMDPTEKEPAKTTQFTLPSLSARIVKFLNKNEVPPGTQLNLSWKVTGPSFRGEIAPASIKAYLYDAKAQTVIKELPSGETASIDFPKKTQVDLLFVCTETSSAFASGGPAQVELEADMPKNARSCHLQVKASGKTTRVATDQAPGDSGGFSLVLHDLPMAFTGDAFTMTGSWRTSVGLLEMTHKVKCTGRFSRDRKMIEELTIAFEAGGQRNSGGHDELKKEKWQVTVKNIPRKPSEDTWYYSIEFDAAAKREKDRTPPPGFEILSCEYEFADIHTTDYKSGPKTVSSKANGLRNINAFKVYLHPTDRPPAANPNEE